MDNTENHNAADTVKTVRLMIGNLPFDLDLTELVQALAHYGQILEAFLSKPSKPENKNSGWAIIVVAEEIGRSLQSQTILIRNRIIKITPARPKP